MQTHSTGPVAGNRQGAVQTQQAFLLDYSNNPTATPIKLCTVKATAAQPVAIRVVGVVLTANNAGTTATASVGTASSGTQFLNGVDAKAAAQTNYIPTNEVMVVVADTDIWFLHTFVGTAATAGQFVVLVTLGDINTVQPTVLGS